MRLMAGVEDWWGRQPPSYPGPPHPAPIYPPYPESRVRRFIFHFKNFSLLNKMKRNWQGNSFVFLFIFHPSDSTVSENAGIQPRTVTTLVLKVKQSNHSSRSNQHPSICAILKVGCVGFSTSKIFLKKKQDKANLTGGFFWIFIQHCFICRPSDSTVSEDAGIKPRTVATLALAVKHSNHSARSKRAWRKRH